MPTRAGELVPLDAVFDEVGVDAARYQLLVFSPDTPVTFDLDEVARQRTTPSTTSSTPAPG